MLYKQILKHNLVKPIEGKIGKLIGMIINTETWQVSHLVVDRTGMLDIVETKVLIPLEYVKEIDLEKRQFILNEEHTEEPVPKVSKKNMFMCKDFINKKVLSSDGQKAGRIFDFDIPEKLQVWKIWKIMINTGMKKRRLRVSPNDIKMVGNEIILQKSFDELFPAE